MTTETRELINNDKLQTLLHTDGINEKELTKDEIKEISKDFSTQDLFPIISKLDRGEDVDGVSDDTTKLKLNILSLINQCNENEKETLKLDNEKKLEAQAAKLEDVKRRQKLEKQKAEEKVDTLKQLLFGDDKDAKNNVDKDNVLKATLQAVALNKENTKTLEEIKGLQEKLKKARDGKDLEEVAKINEELENKKLELKGLLGQKDALYYQYFGEKYDDDNGKGIQEFKRRGKIFGKGKSESGQVVHGVMSPLKPKRIARMRLNRVIRQMNEIGSDSTRGMKMVMNRCYFNGVRPVSRGIKGIKNTFKLKNPAEFSKKYNEQANEFIRDLTQKLEAAGNLSEEDKKTIALIEKRLKWYKEDYKRQFLQM